MCQMLYTSTMSDASEYMEFTFKPALLAKPKTIRLNDEHLHVWEDGEQKDAIRFCEITSFRFISTSVNKFKFYQFHLGREGGKPVYLTVNASALSTPQNDQDVATLYRAAQTLLEKLEPSNLLSDVEIGYAKGGRYAWFGLGVVMVLMAAGIFGLALSTGVRTEKLWGAAFPLGLLGLIGIMTCLGSNPWAPPQRLPIRDFLTYLKVELGEPAPDP